MQSLHHSRARILFDAACAIGVAASCAWAWQQTYATATLSAAAIAGLYGLVRASDMLRSGPKAVESTAVTEAYAAPVAPEPVAEPVHEFVADAAEPSAKRGRKPAKPKAGRGKRAAEPEVVQFAAEPEPEEVVEEPNVVELPPELRMVESAPDEPQYVPATPLFEAEPFVRQQRAAFGRKAR